MQLDVIKFAWVEAVSHRDCQAHIEPFLGLHIQAVGPRRHIHLRAVLDHPGSEQLIAQIKSLQMFHERRYKVDAGVERAWQGATRLAHANAAHAARHNRNAVRDEQGHASNSDHPKKKSPTDRLWLFWLVPKRRRRILRTSCKVAAEPDH